MDLVQWPVGPFHPGSNLLLRCWLELCKIRNVKKRIFWHFSVFWILFHFSWKKWTCTPKRGSMLALRNNATHTWPVQCQAQNLPVTSKLMRSTWLGLAFTRFRYLTTFRQTISVVIVSSQYPMIYKRNTTVWTIYNLIASTDKLSSLIEMTKWHAHVVHMANHINVVGGPVWWEARVPWAPLLNQVLSVPLTVVKYLGLWWGGNAC